MALNPKYDVQLIVGQGTFCVLDGFLILSGQKMLFCLVEPEKPVLTERFIQNFMVPDNARFLVIDWGMNNKTMMGSHGFSGFSKWL